MKKVLVVVLVLISISLLIPSRAYAASNQYFTINVDPIEPDRMLREGECMAKWNSPIPGMMQTKYGYKGGKSLAPLVPVIYSMELNGKVIPSHSYLTLWGCGNGFENAIPLDTMQALGVQCNAPKAAVPASAPPVKHEEQPAAIPAKTPKPTMTIEGTLFGQDIAGSKVKRGSRVKITWNSQFTNECHPIGSSLGLDTGGRTEGEYLTPPLKHDETYAVQCTGLGGSIEGRVFIDVNNHNVIWTVVGIVVAGTIVKGASGGNSNSKAVNPGPTIP